LLTAAFFVVINLVVDLLYALVDPRLRAGGLTGRSAGP
jgi:ABC-type dipeptide/oligopeptide/nickel transport system permease component